jgi:hypothetical protein
MTTARGRAAVTAIVAAIVAVAFAAAVVLPGPVSAEPGPVKPGPVRWGAAEPEPTEPGPSPSPSPTKPAPGPVEPGPTVSATGTICYEKSMGKDPVFIVELSTRIDTEIIVVMHTEDGTAVSPEDYHGSERFMVIIPVGAVRVEVPLGIVDDEEKEDEEYFMVVVDEVYGGVVGRDDRAEIVIKDGGPPKSGR